MYGNGLYCIPNGDFDGVAGIPFPENFSAVDDMDYDGIHDNQVGGVSTWIIKLWLSSYFALFHPCFDHHTTVWLESFQDNCPYIPNANQLDSDWDLDGDVCDNCKLFRNTNQADLDVDGIGDVCDQDLDGDRKPHPIASQLHVHLTFQYIEYLNLFDTCPKIPNPYQADTDADGFGDGCDNCIFVPTVSQVGVAIIEP